MSIGNAAYTVVTEFKFDVGVALLGVEDLKGAVEGLSDSAGQALTSFQSMSAGIVAQFGLGAGGLAGTLYTALKAADKFKMSQIAMANLMGQGTSFDERMGMAAQHMAKINSLANEFGLPSDDLLQLTKLTAPMMRDKSGAPNFNAAIDMSRNLMKAAPTLGVDSSMVAGQMQSAISGHASMGDTLFQRLVADTQTMKGQTSQSFNAQDEHKRITMLRKALKEFTTDTKVLEANVNTLNGQMTLLKNNISGATGVLSQIGSTLMEMVVPVLKEFNAFLANEGQAIAKSIAHGLEPWMKGGWRNLVASLMQLKSFFGDVKLAAGIMQTVGLIMLFAFILTKLEITIPFVSAALKIFSGAIHSLEKDLLRGSLNLSTFGSVTRNMKSTGYAGIFLPVLHFINRLVMAVSNMLAPFLLLVGIFSLLSRADAIASVRNYENITKAAPLMAETSALFSRLIAFFNDGINGMAEKIAWWYESWKQAFLIGLVQPIMDFMTWIGQAVMTFQALTLAVMEFFNQIKSFVTGDGFSFAAIGDAFNFGMEDTFNRIFGKIGDGEGATSNQVTNINKVEINNAFKENAQPDRIAFTMKEQILKAAINPTQGIKTLQGSSIGR